MCISKEEIIVQMKENESYIKQCKEEKKSLEKILSMIADHEKKFEITISSLNDMYVGINKLESNIAKMNEYQIKRKKQLKLLEQLEELDGE